MGQSVEGMIDEFVRAGRVGDVHYRNVSGTLPHFVETLPDDGDVDTLAVMGALCRAGYRGAIYPITSRSWPTTMPFDAAGWPTPWRTCALPLGGRTRCRRRTR